MTKEELISIFDEFINDAGMFQQFKTFIERQGYTMTELGFSEE